MGIPVEVVAEGIDWSAWIQAVGSVGAILVAVAVAWTESRLSDRRALQSQDAFGRLALGIAKQGKDLATDILKTDLTANSLVIDPDNFDDVIETLDKLPFERMPSAEFALAYVNIRRGLRFYGAAYRQFSQLPSGARQIAFDAGLSTRLFNAAKTVMLQYDRLELEAQRLKITSEARPDTDVDAQIKEMKKAAGIGTADAAN